VFTDAVLAITHKEFSDRLRSKWVIVIAVAFAVFSMAISYFGASSKGVAGFLYMEASIANFTSLVIYFIPILALTLGGGVIADERDRGMLELFLSSPISPWEFICGKFSGLSVSLALSTLAGFGISGVILINRVGLESAGSYIVFTLYSVLLGLIFLSLSFLISVLFYERTKVIAFTVFMWLLFTLLYDLALVGLLIVTKGAISSALLSVLLMLNPVDVYRILNFVSIGETKVFLGLASVEFPAFMTTPVLLGIGILWVVLPLIASLYFFKRKYVR
jgi:Cu-processing system permease protein